MKSNKPNTASAAMDSKEKASILEAARNAKLAVAQSEELSYVDSEQLFANITRKARKANLDADIAKNPEHKPSHADNKTTADLVANVRNEKLDTLLLEKAAIVSTQAKFKPMFDQAIKDAASKAARNTTLPAAIEKADMAFTAARNAHVAKMFMDDKAERFAFIKNIVEIAVIATGAALVAAAAVAFFMYAMPILAAGLAVGGLVVAAAATASKFGLFSQAEVDAPKADRPKVIFLDEQGKAYDAPMSEAEEAKVAMSA